MKTALFIDKSPAPPICITPSIKISNSKPQKSRGAGIVTHLERPTDQSADPFTSREDINKIVAHLLNNHEYCKAAQFVFGINTGYRCGDLIAFRVKDFYDEHGKFREVFYVREDKTGKARPVYINKAARIAVETAIQKRHLTSENFVFRGDGNKRSYIVKFIYNENDEIEDVETIGKKYDENGNIREVAPMKVSSITRWLEDLSEELGIYGHHSSHALRQTFSEFIGRDFDDNRNVLVSSVALGHSSVKVTMEHYAKVDPSKLREQWLKLNLGLEALLDFQFN